MDRSSALALSQNTLLIMFVDVQKRFNNSIFRRVTTSDKRFTPKTSMHSLITSLELNPVLNSFIKHLVKTKSRECLSVELTSTDRK